MNNESTNKSRYLMKSVFAGLFETTKETVLSQAKSTIKKSVVDKEFLLGGALFTGFHFATRQQTLVPILKKMGMDNQSSIIASGALRKVVGGAVLGLGAYAMMKANGKTLAEHGVHTGGLVKSGVLITTLTPIFAGIVAQNMKQPVMWQYYPEIRTNDFSKSFAVMSSASWLSYLIGFEFFFRGFLINHWQQKYSTADSLAMTTLLYTLVHLPNNWREMLSCIPMGYIFGGMSLNSNNMASPLIMHWVISTTSDIMSAKYNPDIEFLK